MSKGGGKTQTSTTVTSPWAKQQPYLLEGFDQAYNNLQKPKQMFGGNMIADKTGADSAAEGYLTGYAGTLANQTGTNLNAANWALGPGNLDVGNNQYVQGQMSANTNRLYQDFNDKTVPAIRSNFGQSGQIGGSRQGIAEGLAAQGVSRAAGDSNAQIMGTAYSNALDTYASALSQMPALMQAGTMPGQLLGQVGASQRGFEQDNIDENMARWNFNQNEADTRLAQYMSLISGNWGGTSTATAPTQRTSLLGGMAGGALAGLPFGLPGMAIGAGLGAFAR